MTTPSTGGPARRDLVLATDPCAQPNVRLVVGAARAGALGILDLACASSGSIDVSTARTAVTEVARRCEVPFAVRLSHAATTARPRHLRHGASASRARSPKGKRPSKSARAALPDELALPDQVSTVVLTGTIAPEDADALGRAVAAWDGPRVLVEVVSRDEARLAIEAGADGVVAKGCEGGGRVGTVESFVLAQQVDELGVPFWVQGGVGLRTAAAAVAAGATGVVLEGQLALVRESELTDETRAAVGAMDGSETRVVGDHRIYVRPDLPAAALADDTPAATVAEQLGTDLRQDLLPLGQDAAMAAGLAEQHVTAGGVVQAMRAAVDRHLELATRLKPLAPDAGVARSHRTRYPVVQGPMTRVSDRAEFAAAVADSGGLPFLALALLPGPEVRQLLTQTAELLGDRPWGVGVLGFVPPDVRAAQLEVIHEVGPPVALIAGGRPAQSQPLEDAGIATYLHVPSPGLLDRFLRDGARRFVFEGRECGGHVGPRASLPLWEAQVARLLEVDEPERLDVLFAGGIHDARSAAMVAAIAAPLAERGANVGVLMGTAYLFTREAVECGAITPTFQGVAQGCDTTVLLETAPGHATRCVETDYVRTFAARKAELEASGCAPQELWGELESLNLGRLRMASKGLIREGDQLVELDEGAQRRDGMFMIGQAATLRDGVTTLAELHEQVSTGASGHLDATVAGRGLGETAGTSSATAGPTTDIDVRERKRPSRPLDVAVVGMAALFPGAADTERYWANILANLDAVTEVPRDRWDPATFYDPASVTQGAGRRTPSRWGGFLPPVPFDALAYGIPPRSLASIESVQLLSLEVARRALDDAGYARRAFDRARTAVVFAAENGNDLGGAYGFRAAYPHFVGPLPPELDAHLPAPTEDSFPGVLTNVIAGRIANRLDLGGANFTVDAACAASLAALDVACKELLDGTSDMVLCGAADVHNGINDYLLFSSVHALSPSGRCRPFDARADGIALGEGVACVALKRLADAERDGDRIYAVVEAVAGSSDGRHLGLTAPRKEGQVRAVERAYQRCGTGPASVGLVEAHGTGTVVGDRTELATLTEVFVADGATTGTAVLGSVKSQIGHTKCAAGLAGLIKAARALHAGVLPPTCHVEQPNDAYSPVDSPFRFLDRPAPWPSAERRAGVSAFGFGGTNFHAVLRAHGDDERPAHGLAEWPAELFLIRAPSGEVAAERLRTLQHRVEQVLAADPGGDHHRLRDLAWTVSSAHGGEPVEVAVVADDLADLAAKLSRAGTDSASAVPGVFRVSGGPQGETGAGATPTVAFLHPGQGSQRPRMLDDLFVAFPQLQAGLALGEPWLDRMFPGAAFSAEQRAEQRAALTDTRVAQPTLGLAAVALTRLLRSLGVEPDMTAGHSYGELAALWTGGVLDETALLAVSAARGEAMAAAAARHGGDGDPGAMAAVALPIDEVRSRLTGGVVAANHNAPRQTVVAGPTAAVEALVEQLDHNGIGVRRLDVAAAFHSPLVAGAAEELALHLADVRLDEPALPVWSGSTATPYPADADALRATIAGAVAQPVRFVEQIEAMYAAGARVFVEAGPGRALTQMVGKILGERPHHAVACNVAGEPGLRRLLLALAELAAAGVPVDVRPLFRGRAERVDLGALPRATPGWRVNGHLVCTRDGEPVPGGLQPADRIPEVAMTNGGSVPADNSADLAAREGAVLAYLRSMQQIVDAQRDVMLSYLGETGAALPSPNPELSTPALTAPRATVDVPHRTNGSGTNGAGAVPVTRNGAAGNGNEPADPPPNTAPTTTAAPSPVASSPSPAPPETATPSRLRGDDLLSAILAIVAERTGYPPDMLDPDLDLEADLSIDSIKRIEIVGELADRVGLPGAEPETAGPGVDEAIVEQLARRKSLRSIVDWIDDQHEAGTDDEDDRPGPHAAMPTTGTPAAGATATTGATEPAAGTPTRTAPPVPATVRRFVLETAMLAPALPVASAAGKRLVLVSDPWDGLEELRGRLQRAGATVEVVPVHRGAPGTPLPPPLAATLAQADGVVHLGITDRQAPVDARDVFAVMRPAAAGRASILMAAVGPTPPAAPSLVTGVPGLMRSLARELPERQVRAVELSADQSPAVVARLLADEILDPAGPVSVAYRDGTRVTRRVAKGTPLSGDVPALPFDGGSVVVMTGGARGITALTALAVARATGCRLELLGRSPLPPEHEDPRTAAANDRTGLRRALVEIGELRAPAEVEAACNQIMAAREIRATLQALHSLGCAAAYHQVDVRDTARLHQVLDDIRGRHGRIDAIVHGAGVLDDRLAGDKTDEGFNRVFATKVDAARSLVAELGHDVRLVVLFGSVSGMFGNRGQVDYAAANDALDQLAQRLDGVEGRRIVSIDWGPWQGTGMVSPELEREYARRGVGLVDPDSGVRALLAEMATLPGEPAQVVVMRAEPEAFVDERDRSPVSWPAAASRSASSTGSAGPGRADQPAGVTLEDLTERG